MQLLIYGSGGLGKETLDLAKRINSVHHRWNKISFIDDVRQDKFYYGTQIYKFDEVSSISDDLECSIAQGEPKFRELLYNKVLENGMNIATMVDPTAIVSETASIGVGSIISAFTLLASNVTVCENVLIQPMVNIGHDIYIGKHSVISSAVFPGGFDHIGDRVYIGMNTTIREKVNIGDDVIVGMGSVVHCDIEPGLIAMGNPARPMKRNESGRVFH